MLQRMMVPSVLTCTAVLWREFQKIIWSTSRCPQLLRDFVQCHLQTECAVSVLSYPPSPSCCYRTTASLCMYPRAENSGIPECSLLLFLVLNLRRESGCGRMTALTMLTFRRHPFLFPFSPPLLSLLWIRLSGLKFRWWLDCFGVRWSPKSQFLHPWGSSVRWVRCKSLLKFESSKLVFVHNYKAKGQ